ncbi:MAG: TM2 domain-containing protein [Prochloraceae cyanobacterium]|nr:TM2 domain-containing protein [Prochloraceae cyanobacterium]
MRNTVTAYLLWCFWFLGFAGIHRFYLGKPLTGLIWFFSWGVFGIGQIIDLLMIPWMVEEQNFKYRALYGLTPAAEISPFQTISIAPESDTHIILKLLKDNIEVTLADCVLATEKDVQTVKDLLLQMQRDELIEIGNRESDGVVVYRMV